MKPRASSVAGRRGAPSPVAGRTISLAAVRALLLLALLPAPSLGEARETFSGKCVGVVDGDTIEVLRDGVAVRVRLEGIDAPERGQDFSQKAKQKLSDLAFDQEVAVSSRGVDRWGRLIARVEAGGVGLSEEMVRSGLAWHFEKYSADETLAQLQREARIAGRGLWVVTRPMAPWEFREVRQALRREERNATEVVRGPYHGNTSSRVFHAPHCQHYRCKNCTRVFESRDGALEAGFRPCQRCRP